MKFISLKSLLLFLIVLTAVMLHSTSTSKGDVDLGIPIRDLAFWEITLWCLPLAIFLWFIFVLIVKAWLWYFKKRGERKIKM